MKLSEIKEKLQDTGISPGDLSQLLVVIASEYGALSEELKDILKTKAIDWINLRKDVKSDTQAERLWGLQTFGIREMELRLDMKSMEKMMSAIRTRLHVMGVEAMNQY